MNSLPSMDSLGVPLEEIRNRPIATPRSPRASGGPFRLMPTPHSSPRACTPRGRPRGVSTSPRGVSTFRDVFPCTPRDKALAIYPCSWKPVCKIGGEDGPLSELESDSFTASGNVLEAELQRQVKSLHLCVDKFLESREDVSNQLLSQQLRLISLLEEYKKPVFETAQTTCKRLERKSPTRTSSLIAKSLDSHNFDLECVERDYENKVPVKHSTCADSVPLNIFAEDLEASLCDSWCIGTGSVSLSPEDSAHDVGNLELRWAILTRLAIKTFSRVRWQLLSCWVPSVERRAQRCNIMKAIRENLGECIQSFDPVLDEWAVRGHYKARRNSLNGPARGRARKVRDSLRENGNLVNACNHSFACLPVLHPLSFRRLVWTILGLFCVGYDAFLLTLGVFETLETDAIKAVDWILRIFWTLDIGVSFRTGFHVKAHYEDRPHKIARKYVSSWLIVDLISLVPDTLVALLDSGGSGVTSYSSTLRWLKIFKILRLMRLAKCVHLFTGYLESLNSTNAVLAAAILKYVFLMIIWVHLCGCGWYWIGKRSADSWLHKNKVDHLQLPEIYVVSVQWALSLLQGNTDVFAAFNVTEFSYVVAAMLLSILVMTVFISNVTNVIVALQFSWDRKSKQMRALQEYLHRHQVPAALAEIVRKHAEEKMQVDKKLQLGEDDVTDCLPQDVRRQLLQEVRGRMVRANSIVFVALKNNQAKNFEKLCCDMLMPLFFTPGKSIYRYAQDCNTTYFNIAGIVTYEHIANKLVDRWVTNFFEEVASPRASPRFSYTNSESSEQLVREKSPGIASPGALKRSKSSFRSQSSRATGTLDTNGVFHQDSSIMDGLLHGHLQSTECLISRTTLSNTQPICEASLFVYWTHMGFMTATTHAAFLSLDSADFSLLAQIDRGFSDFLINHALRFCRVMNHNSTHPSDLTTSIDVLNILQTHGEILVNSVRSSVSGRSSLS